MHQLDNQVDFLCGLGKCRPQWLQRFATKRCFLLIFCLTSICQGMYFTYIVSVLTTLEKLYQMPSRTMGVIISASELGQIFGSLALAYFGGRGDRPKWIGLGVLIFGISSLLCSSPHWFFGDTTKKLTSNEGINLTSIDTSKSLELVFQQALCTKKNSQTDASCLTPIQTQDVTSVARWASTIFAISSLLVGIGTTAVNTLGIPYLDDNVAPKESPLYFAITIGLRVFGPAIGFLLGSLCTSIYIQFPFDNGGGLSPIHPQWVGAWWLGVFIIGIVLFFLSFVMMSFPKRLPHPDPNFLVQDQTQKMVTCLETGDCCMQEKNSLKKFNFNNNNLLEKKNLMNGTNVSKDENDQILSLANEKSLTPNASFMVTIKRLLRNRILLCRITSSILHILPISGLYTFLPKYLENQFQLTASDASLISGVAGILVMGFGIFSSGIIMRKFNPNPKLVTRWIATMTLIYSICMFMLIFVGCSQPKMVGLPSNSIPKDHAIWSELALPGTCSHCDCPSPQFVPVCASNGDTYVSACHAGCSQLNSINGQFNYTNCTCLPKSVSITSNGFCKQNCDNLIFYVLIFSLLAFIHSTTEVGSMLVTLRCVQPEDKAVALGLVTLGCSLFGCFPCPIIYGSIVDSSCLHWQEDCGRKGACHVFDTAKFRIYFHGLTSFIMFLAFLIDFCICMNASRIKFFEDDPTPLAIESISKEEHLYQKMNDKNNNDDKMSLEHLKAQKSETEV